MKDYLETEIMQYGWVMKARNLGEKAMLSKRATDAVYSKGSKRILKS